MARFMRHGLLPLLFLVAGIGGGLWFVANPDEAQKRPPPAAQALLVETGRPERGDYAAVVEAMGRVMPAVEAALRPQVSGEIIETAPAFIPGGFFSTGETILKIDPEDYALAVRKQKAILRQVEADFRMEEGRQDLARNELDILERTTGHRPENPELALRGPQLAQIRAELEKAQADMDTAQLDLERTTITAPFNALVTARQVNRGDKVSPSETLATLVSTDEYWVEAALPVNDLRWLDLSPGQAEGGAPAQIIPDGGRGKRQGIAFKLTGTLDPRSRLATILVRVPDPLLLKSAEKAGAPLILGDYVKVEIAGRPLEDALRIPLSWLRDNNRVWVIEGGQLAVREIEILYEDRRYAYIGSGLSERDIVVASEIAVPSEGMKLRTMEEARTQMRERMQGPKGANGHPISETAP